MWQTVELREIRVFLTLAEELHFGRTADRLDLTPSRVSQTIRALETRVGGQLFVRTSRRVRLTPLGEQLLRRMEPAYEHMEQAFAQTREEATGVAGPLRIGTYMPVNYGPHFLEIAKTFETRHPDCRVVTTDTGLTRDQFDWLRHDDLDLLAMRLPVSEPDVTIGPILSREPRIVVVATEHPLARRESVCVEDLADCSLPYSSKLPREMMDAFIPPRTPSGRALHRVEDPTLSDAMVRVATGELVHMTVRSFLDHFRNPGVVGIPIRDLPPSETALMWLTAREGGKIQAFARAAADVMGLHEREHQDDGSALAIEKRLSDVRSATAGGAPSGFARRTRRRA
jgi:DNA-binding transcriptional LysR family regulator